MTQLKYTLRNDILFKLLFVKYPWLLKRLVAELLRIKYEDIWQFEIINPEIPPEAIGRKFCRLDINMIVNGQRVDLEIQDDRNKGHYPERSLFYWARDYSSSLPEGDEYGELPRTIVINILNFRQFDCKAYYSEFPPLEITRHTLLTDKMKIIFYELPKLPRKLNVNNILELLLHLFKSNTEEEIERIKKLEVSLMQEAIEAFHSVAASAQFRELERLRSKARHDEAQALYDAKQEEREKWQSVVAEKDSVISEKDSVISEKDSVISEKDSVISEKDLELANKDAIIAELMKRLGGDK